MDPLTHLIISKVVVGKDRSVLIAGLAPDVPFYATYPIWIIASRQLVPSVQQNSWPEPPAWMYVPHHIAHSLPVILTIAVVIRLRTGHWQHWALAWLIHILIDIPLIPAATGHRNFSGHSQPSLLMVSRGLLFSFRGSNAVDPKYQCN